MSAADEFHRIRSVLSYNPDTGALTWKVRDPSMFEDGKQTAEHNCAIWNGKFAGKPALSSPDKRGYLTGNLFSRPTKAHRAVWALVYGEWPIEVDHINGDPSDNRLSNLRAVTHCENGRNLKLKSNNSTGICGVWRRPSGRWAATITVAGSSKTIGTFDTIDQAIGARRNAERAYGFHNNHGRRT